jgi:cyclopropane fatty-acyl-phospholipid synthase-like methyltransferase
VEPPCNAAAARNTAPILTALTGRIPVGASVLEIGSGTGQHCCAFAPALDVAHWQPTDLPAVLGPLAARIEATGDPRIGVPIALDVASDAWPSGPFDRVFTANTFHIMAWPRVLDCLHGVVRVLREGGLFIVYGPFRDGELHNADSNAVFDRTLRASDPDQGVRDLLQIIEQAQAVGLIMSEQVAMPANNRLVLFRKQA